MQENKKTANRQDKPDSVSIPVNAIVNQYYCDLCEKTYCFKSEESKKKHIVNHFYDTKKDIIKLYKPRMF